MEPANNHKSQARIEWIAMFLLIGNTANPFFYQSIEMLFLSFLVLLTLLFFKKGDDTRINRHFWIYVLILTVLQAAQTLVYHVFPLKTFMGEYLRIAFAITALKILGQGFFPMFVRFVYFFAVISLCFYIPCMLIKPLGPFLIHNIAKHLVTPFVRANLADFYISKENLIIFNLGQIDLHRNSGFYWEPGVHGAFLVMALFVNLFYRGEKWNSKINLVFLVTILTTLSTTTYLALFFVILVYLKNFFLRRPVLSLFCLLAIAGSAFLLYNKLDFLNKKIDEQLAKREKGVAGESRFSSFLLDVQQMGEHPFIGTGRNIEMKFGKNFYNVGSQQLHRNNGLGILLSTYGIFFFFYFFYLNWRSFCKLLDDNVTASMLLILMLILGFSEDYFFKAFFIAMALYCGISIIPAEQIVMTPSRKMKLGKNTLTYE